MTREERWMENYKALKAFVKENGHFAPKNTTLSNWTKYQRRRINQGKMPKKQLKLFKALAESRDKNFQQITFMG